MKTTKVKQYALSHATSYKIVDSFYAGSLIDGGGTVCQNCGALIVNVAIMEDASGTRYFVGMDCAESLAGLMSGLDQWDFNYTHKTAFSEAKAYRAKLLKYDKKYASRTTTATAHSNGTDIFFDTVVFDAFGNKQTTWQGFNKTTAEKYVLPMVKDLIANNPA